MAPDMPIGSRTQGGASYLWAVLAIAVMGIYLARIGEVWWLRERSADETELLRRGDAIRAAIEAYEKASSGGDRYPRALKDLLLDPRSPTPRRFLRRAYLDPMTGDDWETIRGPSGELYGVNSALDLAPIKQDGFPSRYAQFRHQRSYRQWRFEVHPQATASDAPDVGR